MSEERKNRLIKIIVAAVFGLLLVAFAVSLAVSSRPSSGNDGGLSGHYGSGELNDAGERQAADKDGYPKGFSFGDFPSLFFGDGSTGSSSESSSGSSSRSSSGGDGVFSQNRDPVFDISPKNGEGILVRKINELAEVVEKNHAGDPNAGSRNSSSSSASSSASSARGTNSGSSSAENSTKVTSKNSAPLAEEEYYGQFTVDKVVDGDTIRIKVDGRNIYIRMIGVDTPESVHVDESRNTPEGKVASDYTKSRLTGETVTLYHDAEKQDKYGRELCYVYLSDGTFYNLELAEKGYARAMTIEPNTLHHSEIEAAAEQAKKSGIAIW